MLHVVGLHAWRVVIFSTMLHSTMCWDCIFALPWFELGTQFSWVQIELPLLFSQSWNTSTSLFSSSESSLNPSLAKSLRSLQHRSSGCTGGRAPHISISNWKIFTSHCFSTFWRDRKSLCTVLVMQPLCPDLTWLFFLSSSLSGSNPDSSVRSPTSSKVACCKAVCLRAIFSLIARADLNSPPVSSVIWL